MNDIAVTVIESHNDWQKIGQEWNLLLKASGSDSVFLTYEWLSAWAEHCIGQHRNLYILTFHEKGSLVGVAPFYIQRTKFGPLTLREIRFLGSPEAGSDYLDVFTIHGREREVTNSLYDILVGERKNDWDIICLQEIPANSLFLLYFSSRIKAEGKNAELVYNAYCPIVKLSVSEAEYHATLSPGWKKKYKQDIRVVNRDLEVLHEVTQGSEVEGKLAEFFRLYEEKGGWSGDTIRMILERLVKKNNGDHPVQIDMLTINGQLVAGLLHLKYQGTLSMYLMAVDKEYNPKVSLGNLLVGESIRDAITLGYCTYDFLKGVERYKFHWSNCGKTTLQFNFWQKNPVALISAFERLARCACKLILR